MYGILAGAALGAGQSIFNYAMNNRQADTAYRRQKELNAQQFQYNNYLARQQHEWQTAENLAAFNREKEWALNEREYNSPMAQLERLRAAGINPAVGMSDITNVSQNPLNMSADAAGAASVGGSSAPQAQAVQIPQLTSIMQGIQGLELARQQINESKERQNLLAAQALNVNANTKKTLSTEDFWTDLAKYDVEWKKNNARSVYRDILEKTWSYKFLFPRKLQQLDEQIKNLSLDNQFKDKSFKDRLDAIVKSNILLDKQAQNIDSQISYRDFQTTQQELTNSQYRSLLGSQQSINEMNKTINGLQEAATKALKNGKVLDAIRLMMMLNFMKQSAQGSFLPSPGSMITKPMDMSVDFLNKGLTLGGQLGFFF